MRVVIEPLPELEKRVLRGARLERVESDGRTPSVQQFSDLGSDVNDRYTPGSIGELYGLNLKFDPDDPQQGVFFVAQASQDEGPECRVETYAHVSRRRVTFLVPPDLAGHQRVEVRAVPRYSTRLHAGRYDSLVLPVEEIS